MSTTGKLVALLLYLKGHDRLKEVYDKSVSVGVPHYLFL
jgi:hypothetical protein